MVRYDHRQRGPWLWLLGMPGAVVLCGGLWSGVLFLLDGELGDLVLFADFTLVGLLWVGGAACLAWLDVWDDGECLGVRFRPIPLFGTRIPYGAIESVERMRTNLLYGLGLNGIPGWFTCYGTWGFDAVRIRLKKRYGFLRVRTVIVGTDDSERLAAFLTDMTGVLPREP
jgi:hypothetical protein